MRPPWYPTTTGAASCGPEEPVGRLVVSDQSGPSYYDVQVAVEHLRDVYGVGVDFVLVPPLYIRATGKKKPWGVVCRAWYLGTSRESPYGDHASFGQGGQWRTLPAAAHSALLSLQAKLESARLSAEQVAAF